MENNKYQSRNYKNITTSCYQTGSLRKMNGFFTQNNTPNRTSYQKRLQISMNLTLKPRYEKITNISQECRTIQQNLSNPDCGYCKSRSHTAHFKHIQYRRLFKNWCGYHENVVNTGNLTLFHDYITKLTEKVYPFTLMKDQKEFTQKYNENPYQIRSVKSKLSMRTEPGTRKNQSPTPNIFSMGMELNRTLDRKTRNERSEINRSYIVKKINKRHRVRPENYLL